VDDAQVDARAFDVELCQRCVKGLVHGIACRDMDPVDNAARRRDRGIDKLYRAPQVGGRKRRPAAESAEAEVEAQLHRIGNGLGQSFDRRHACPNVGLGGDVLGGAVDGRDFPGAFPLNRQILVGYLGQERHVVSGYAVKTGAAPRIRCQPCESRAGSRLNFGSNWQERRSLRG
jgi:hypothetical protein